MTSKIRRTLSVLCLVAAIASVVLSSVSGFCETLRFVFLADSRGGNETIPINPVLNNIIEKINHLHPRPVYVVFGGDMAYRGFIHGRNMLQEVKDLFKPLTDNGTILFATVGNHELYQQGQKGFFIENQVAFQTVFTDNPDDGPRGYEKLAYSFLSPEGDAFFAVLDPYYLTADEDSQNLGGNVTSAQLHWLAAKIDQTKATHKFLFIHTPYYYVTGQEPDENSTSNESHTKLWNLLDQNQFDFLACGHQHLYSRKAIDSSIPPQPQISPPVGPWQNNVVQLLNGTCGAHPDNSTAYIVDPTLWHVANAPETYYFSVVDVNGNRVTVTSYKGGRTGDFAVFDTFTINQPGIVPASSEWSTIFCALVLVLIAFALIRRRVSKQA